LFQPFTKEQSAFWGYEKKKEKEYVDFIVGIKSDGNEKLKSSKAQPDYLVPVHFRKQVLDKYYQQSCKYSVEDGYLRCGGLWGMQMDNHHKDKVIAWLGDLGRDLPYKEQLHWKSYNIPPAGRCSQTFFKRQILAEFADSDNPEHIFKSHYAELSNICKANLGWPLLLPLVKGDAHYLRSVRIPSSNEQKDFDDLVLALSKILIDSLNENEILKLIPASEHSETTGSIRRLEKMLVVRKINNYEDHIEFLRNLQSLRSSGTAHRKGWEYEKLSNEMGLGGDTLQRDFETILIKSIRFLEYLISIVERELKK
jgi:hypothetical protein